MNYSEAIAYIHSTYRFGRKLGLENIRQLLDLMDNPHRQLKVIHVAGTNGKGSTSAFIANILLEAGYSVGLFSSPFLQIFNERIRLNRQNIPNDALAEITAYVKERVDMMVESGFDHPTEFEIVTAIAFEYYKRTEADYVVLEVGMGGRLDSTNIIDQPLCSVITPIALDHMDYLGETLAEIAKEKGGIIKPGGLVIAHPQDPDAMAVLRDISEAKGAKLVEVSHEGIEIQKESLTETRFKYGKQIYSIGLLGRHQVRNAIVAMQAARHLPIEGLTEEVIARGLKVTVWPGRMEILSRKPLTIIDGAHNLHGALGLRETVEELLKDRHVIGVIGVLADKDVDHILDTMLPLLDEVVVTEPNSSRRMPYGELLGKVRQTKRKSKGFERVLEAVIDAKSKAKPEDVILIFGSLYMIGEVRSILSE